MDIDLEDVYNYVMSNRTSNNNYISTVDTGIYSTADTTPVYTTATYNTATMSNWYVDYERIKHENELVKKIIAERLGINIDELNNTAQDEKSKNNKDWEIDI